MIRLGEVVSLFKNPMAVAAIDRVVHHSVPVELTGSMRPADAAEQPRRKGRRHERADDNYMGGGRTGGRWGIPEFQSFVDATEAVVLTVPFA